MIYVFIETCTFLIGKSFNVAITLAIGRFVNSCSLTLVSTRGSILLLAVSDDVSSASAVVAELVVSGGVEASFHFLDLAVVFRVVLHFEDFLLPFMIVARVGLL